METGNHDRQLYEYLESHGLLNPAQSGFRPLHNAQDVILKTIDDWKLEMGKGKVVGAVMIDLSKAFKSIDHSFLLAKLNAYGVCGTELMLFTNYLGRRQGVVLNGVVSGWDSVTNGVPHRSILGPLMFIIFISNLPDVVEHCTVDLYADDTAIYASGEDPGTVGSGLEQDLQWVSNWIATNGLRMNISKTQLMVLSSRKKQWLANSVHVNIGEGSYWVRIW